MTSRRLIILAALAIVALLGALLVTRQPSSGGDASQALYPKLKSELDAIKTVRLYQPGDKLAVELTRGEQGWTVAQRANYPAETAKVHRLLRALADAKQVEEKTSNPENYPTLGVEDISNAAATGSRVQLEGNETPVNLIVGKRGMGSQSTYVRRADQPASWLIDVNVEAPASPQDWLNKDIVSIASNRIQSATVAADGKTYTASKQSRDAADFAVNGLPKGRELSSPSAAYSAGSALTALTLADVKPAAEFADAKPDTTATYRTFDGLVLELNGWTRDGKHYLAVQPAFDEALEKQFHLEPAKPAETTGEAPEGAPPSAPSPTSTVDAKAEAQKAGARLSGWVYEIPDYKYEVIFKPVEELLKEK